MKMSEIAEIAILNYLSDGAIKKPSNFDHDFLGGSDVYGLFSGRLSFNNSPFGKALGNLVDTKIVKYWVDENKDHNYQIEKLQSD